MLAWNPKLDLKDNEGYTPLHLAIKSLDASETTRMVRALLIKGAQTNIADNRGNIPADYLRDIENEDLVNDIREIFSRTPSLKNLITGGTPTKKANAN